MCGPLGRTLASVQVYGAGGLQERTVRRPAGRHLGHGSHVLSLRVRKIPLASTHYKPRSGHVSGCFGEVKLQRMTVLSSHKESTFFVSFMSYTAHAYVLQLCRRDLMFVSIAKNNFRGRAWKVACATFKYAYPAIFFYVLPTTVSHRHAM